MGASDKRAIETVGATVIVVEAVDEGQDALEEIGCCELMPLWKSFDSLESLSGCPL